MHKCVDLMASARLYDSKTISHSLQDGNCYSYDQFADNTKWWKSWNILRDMARYRCQYLREQHRYTTKNTFIHQSFENIRRYWTVRSLVKTMIILCNNFEQIFPLQQFLITNYFDRLLQDHQSICNNIVYLVCYGLDQRMKNDVKYLFPNAKICN